MPPKSPDVEHFPAARASMPTRSSPPSTKRQVELQNQAERRYGLRFRGVVANDVARWGLDNSDFEPTLRTIFAEIRLSPRSFPPKHDELDGARSAHIAFRGKTWCVVYDVDEDYFEVMVLSIGPHHAAYRKAARRRR